MLAAFATLVAAVENDTAHDWPPGFIRLYHDEYEAMVRLARLVTGRNEAAEDLVQDCYLRLAARWGQVAQPGGYLRRSVVNAANSYLRKYGRLRPLEHASDELADATPEIDETWKALRRLSPRRRTAIVLRYYEDLSDDEIAAALDCRPATVRSLIHRGLRQLEEVLA